MLIAKDAFVGLEDVVHLCAGGETPLLKSHQGAIERFFADKALGELSRDKFEETYARCKAKVAQLLHVQADEIAFLSSSTEGINTLAYALDWQPGDNVVVCDVEFPSDVLPWTQLEAQGVAVRIVPHRDWQIQVADLAAAMDERTRVVAASYVSYFTGQRLPLVALSKLVRASNALLLIDATHAAGVVDVPAHYADILVSSCYKWLLGVHGTAVFYWNRQRLPELQPPFLGWHSGTMVPNWQNPTEYILRDNADRFVPANPSFISLYILENALDCLQEIGLAKIEPYVLGLSEQVWQGLTQLGLPVMTPSAVESRAGNVCFTGTDLKSITDKLAERGVLVWGSYNGVGRVRISTHLYNTKADVDRLLSTLEGLL